MINIRDLKFSYEPDGFELRVDDLSIDAGKRAALIGASGSGKTTLLHLVAGIACAEEGHVESCGLVLTGLGDAARRNFRIANVGLVFQDFALLDYLSVRDNILLPYRINRSLRLDSTASDRAEHLAKNVGLESLLSREPMCLSQGERQRVAICRALVTSPKLILADEPTANLDPDNSARVLDAIESHAKQQQATLVVVTHDHGLIPRFDQAIDVSTYGHSAQAHVAGGKCHA